MQLKGLIEKLNEFEILNKGSDLNREVTVPYCCDLLSIAIGKMPQGAVWVTVMANTNALAVASLAEAACIILAEGSKLEEADIIKAKEKGITVLRSELPVFDCALLVYKRFHD